MTEFTSTLKCHGFNQMWWCINEYWSKATFCFVKIWRKTDHCIIFMCSASNRKAITPPPTILTGWNRMPRRVTSILITNVHLGSLISIQWDCSTLRVNALLCYKQHIWRDIMAYDLFISLHHAWGFDTEVHINTTCIYEVGQFTF